MNVPESTAFEYAERRRSDFADVQKILNVTGVSARVENVNRFSPKSLQADRPPFLKVRFSSEEEKKQVFAAVLSNISRIRSLCNEFAQVTASDPVKSAKTVNNYRTNIASLTFGSNVSQHKPADPVLSPTFVHPVSLSDCQDASNGNNVYPSSTFGNRQHSSSNNVAAPLDSDSSLQTVYPSSFAMAATSANTEPLGDRLYRSKISALDRRLQQTFSSPKKPSSSSVQVARYTQGGSGQYSSDDEN
uniref:Uncharacterized protein n=1 Tax=Panagrolaimus davidi TaxID=227884 RepID=A0A914Q4J6_9BILA